MSVSITYAHKNNSIISYFVKNERTNVYKTSDWRYLDKKLDKNTKCQYNNCQFNDNALIDKNSI